MSDIYQMYHTYILSLYLYIYIYFQIKRLKNNILGECIHDRTDAKKSAPTNKNDIVFSGKLTPDV